VLFPIGSEVEAVAGGTPTFLRPRHDLGHDLHLSTQVFADPATQRSLRSDDARSLTRFSVVSARDVAPSHLRHVSDTALVYPTPQYIRSSVPHLERL
jgi:hypothetical protein